MKNENISNKAEYFTAWFHCASLPVPLPDSFGIVTPCNPYGRVLSNEENSARLETLQTRLTDLNVIHFRVDGGSRDKVHLEPGFGVIMNKDELVLIGREFDQDAVFWVQNDKVSIITCDSCETSEVCLWSERCRIIKPTP